MAERRKISPVYSGQVGLRPLEEKDLPMTLGWRNQESIRKWFFNSKVLTREQHYRWFHAYENLDDDYVFIIEMLDGTIWIPVGQVALYHIEWNTLTSEYGRLMIGEPAAQGKGVAKAATKMILEIGFNIFNLNEIYLEVYENNLPARAIYTDCGFKILSTDTNIVKMRILREEFK